MLTDSFARSNTSFLCKSFVILLFWFNIRLFPCPSLFFVFLRFQGISFLTQLRDLASTPVAWNLKVCVCVCVHAYTHICVCVSVNMSVCISPPPLRSQSELEFNPAARNLGMGWLRLVGSLKSWVSLAEYSLFVCVCSVRVCM